MKIKFLILAACFAPLSCGGGGGGCVIMLPGPAPSAETLEAAKFATLRDDYFLRALELNPVTSTYLGGDGYRPQLAATNGRLRDYSEDALTKEIAFYRDTQAALQKIDASKLPPPLTVDLKLMNAQIRFVLHQIADRKYYRRAIDTYVGEPFRGIDWQLQGMMDFGNQGRGTEDEWKMVVARLGAIPHYLDVAKTNLLAGKQAGDLPDRRMVQSDGIEATRSNADYFRSTFPSTSATLMGKRRFADDLLSQLRQAAEHAAGAYEAFGKFVADTYDVKEKVDRFAAGAEEYEWRVHNALGDGRSAAELFDYGAAQVAHYDSLLKEVARQIDPAAKTVLDVAKKLSDDAPRSDEEMFAWYRETASKAIAYGRERGLFDVPQDYKLDIVPTPAILAGTVDATYYPAPPLKRSGVGRFYLSPTHNDLAALRVQHNRAAIADTTIHEGFPGHDWHFKFMTQHGGDISNIRWLTPGAVEDSSSMWSDSMAAEGWGLYAEELMAEPAGDRPYGFYTPAEYLYELQGQMMRAVRVRVDVGIHTGRMTFDEARDYFADMCTFILAPAARATPTREPRVRFPSARFIGIRSGRRRRLPTTSARTRFSICATRTRRSKAPPTRQKPSTKSSWAWEPCPSVISGKHFFAEGRTREDDSATENTETTEN